MTEPGWKCPACGWSCPVCGGRATRCGYCSPEPYEWSQLGGLGTFYECQWYGAPGWNPPPIEVYWWQK